MLKLLMLSSKSSDPDYKFNSVTGQIIRNTRIVVSFVQFVDIAQQDAGAFNKSFVSQLCKLEMYTSE